MYMIAFVTLVVALIGAYAQAWTLQVRNVYQNQTAISDAMIAWHQAAVGIAGNLVPPDIACSLTNPPPSYPTTPLCSQVVTSAHVPPGYQTDSYTFYSAAFKIGTTPAHYYVLTFVPKATTTLQVGVDLLCLPGGNACKRLPISFSGFAAQVARNPRISEYSFGTVRTGTACTPTAAPCLITSPVALLESFAQGAAPVRKSLVYPLPSLASENAIGIITELPCSGS